MVYLLLHRLTFLALLSGFAACREKPISLLDGAGRSDELALDDLRLPALIPPFPSQVSFPVDLPPGAALEFSAL